MKLTDEERIALALLLLVLEAKQIRTAVVTRKGRGPITVDLKRPMAVLQKLLDRNKAS